MYIVIPMPVEPTLNGLWALRCLGKNEEGLWMEENKFAQLVSDDSPAQIPTKVLFVWFHSHGFIFARIPRFFRGQIYGSCRFSLGETRGCETEGKRAFGLLWMDEILHHLETIKKPLFMGIYRGFIIPGFLRWCEMDFVHPQYGGTFLSIPNSGPDSACNTRCDLSALRPLLKPP